MINVFVLHNGRLSQINIENRADLENTLPVWVDLTDPNEEEREWVKSIYGVTLPGEDEVKDIEASARYYEADSGDLHLRTDFLIDENEDDEPARTVTVAFILARDILFSVHNTDLPVFRLVRMRARSRPVLLTITKMCCWICMRPMPSIRGCAGRYLSESGRRQPRCAAKDFSDQDAAAR
jgi:magnesium transporter